MKTWEYCILNSRPDGSSITYVKSDGRHIQEKIDSPFTAMAQLGDAGWELVASYVVNREDGVRSTLMDFKRPIPRS